jgi:very-short-patch-repair endonuclease
MVDLVEHYNTVNSISYHFLKDLGAKKCRLYEQINLASTFPDFMWREKKKVVYLDGVQVHAKSKVEERDERINAMLNEQGWQVLRIVYNPPLSAQDVQRIVWKIEGFLSSSQCVVCGCTDLDVIYLAERWGSNCQQPQFFWVCENSDCHEASYDVVDRLYRKRGLLLE